MSYTLKEIKDKTIPVAKNFGVKSISLFGSYARGEATEDSDIDFYIDKGRLNSLIKYYRFVDELEKKFGCHVDVVTTSIQDEDFLSSIQSEGVLLYEQS
ncbi:MAG: nucleotidyltransferase domain-containing protein [Lachnospiraceae bacterium]|nr:nucleotidyltransferase domain-containing protein [Lachnospiraceae bacterium]